MTRVKDDYSQSPYRVRLEWGRRGARRAAARGDLRVVVDTLSFSSAVVTALHHGAAIFPCHEREDVAEVARRLGAEPGGWQGDGATGSRFTLSPAAYVGVAAGTRVAVRSPNGASCCRTGRGAVLVGCLLNASAVARAANVLAGKGAVTVVACGERWQTRGEDGALRVALEDLIGAGAIIAALPGERSPEARAAAAVFQDARADMAALIADCGSGRELIARGRAADVAHAAQLDRYDTVPLLDETGWLRAWRPEPSSA